MANPITTASRTGPTYVVASDRFEFANFALISSNHQGPSRVTFVGTTGFRASPA
jgi:hypothetical protein